MNRSSGNRCARPAAVPVLALALAMPGLALLAPVAAKANLEPEGMFTGAGVDQVVDALLGECYRAGMFGEIPASQMIVCSSEISRDETPPPGVSVAHVHGGHVRHKLRFALAERAAGIRVWASSWLEIEEPDGTLLEEPVESAHYLGRVQTTLQQLAVRLASGDGRGADQPWAERYESEREWQLDAHLKAVAHCDNRLAELDPQWVERQLRAAAIRPFGETLRSRCEALYERVFEWGLARGVEAAGVDDYLAYRTAMPPEQRDCPARLALMTRCE